MTDTALLGAPPEGAARPDPVRRALGSLLVDSAYVLTGFPIALVAFVLLVTGVSLSAGLLVLVVGVPVLALTLVVAGGFARLERARVAPVLGRPLRRRYRPRRSGLAAVVDTVADPRRWLDLGHGIAAFPVATATWSLLLTWWAAALGGLSYGLWAWALPDGDGDQRLAELLGWPGRAANVVGNTVLGALALVTLPLVARGCAAVQTGLARLLLDDTRPAS